MKKGRCILEFENSKPIYLQVIDDIKRKMVMGVIPPGDKLPSVRDLALTYTINPNTASRVYREMEMMSLCFTRRGLGTFITEDPAVFEKIRHEMAHDCLADFVNIMQSLGYRDTEDMVAQLRAFRAENTENS
jgi:DNA-binding transcriptional regulator YhcF (GntR family)